MPVFQLSDKLEFPSPLLARSDGLLAIGGDLSLERLLLAYRRGIFPWFSDDTPILWWSPDPRLVLYPHRLKISKSLKKNIRKNIFRITMDQAFEQVISACAEVRLKANERTWIGADMIASYCRLHESGFAHSVEAWHEGELAGGVYGVSLGGCFFGESMFTRISNASKVAFVKLVNHLEIFDFDMVDCQISTSHLINFGAKEVSRKRFMEELERSLRKPTPKGKWSF